MAEPTTWAFVCTKENNKEVQAKAKILESGMIDYVCLECGGSTETVYYEGTVDQELTRQQMYPEIYR